MSGFGIWVVLPKNVEVLYLDKKSPQYEWIWDLGGLAKKCRGIIPTCNCYIYPLPSLSLLVHISSSSSSIGTAPKEICTIPGL